MSVLPSPFVVEPGQEDNLLVHECARCQEPMGHLCELLEDYPLWRLWELSCGECGSQVLGWEPVPVDWGSWQARAVGE